MDFNSEFETSGIIMPPNSKKPAGSTAGFYASFYPQVYSQPAITHTPGTSKYMTGYTPRDGDLESYAADRQGTFASIGNAITQGVLGEIVGLGIEGIGSVGELAQLMLDPIYKYDNDFNNIVMELGSSIREEVKEQFPIYRQNRDEHFDWDDWNWWMEGLVSVASTVGLLAPSMATTKGLGVMAKYLGYLTNINKPISTTAKAMLQTATSSVFMRNAENASESSMTYRNLRDEALLTLSSKSPEEFQQWLETPAGNKLKQRLPKGETPNADNMSKLIAGNSALNQYYLNAGNVVFDMFQMYPVYKMGRIKTRASLANADVKRAAMESMGLPVAAKSRTSKIMEGAGSVLNYLKRGWSEAPEEVINGIAQEEGLGYGKALIDGKSSMDGTWRERLGEYLTAPRIWEQGFYGWMGGQMFSTATDVYNKIKYKSRNISDPLSAKSQIENIKERSVYLNAYSGKYKAIMDGFDFTNVDENGKPKPISGTPEEKQETINRLVAQLNKEMTTEMTLGSIMSANKNYGAVHTGLVGDLLEWVQSPAFEESFSKQGMTDSDISSFKQEATENILSAERYYKEAHGGIFEKVSDPAISNILINKYAQIRGRVDSLIKTKNEIDAQLQNLKASDPFYLSTYNTLTQAGYDVESTLNDLTNSMVLDIISGGLAAYNSEETPDTIKDKLNKSYPVAENYKAVPNSSLPESVVNTLVKKKLYDLAVENLNTSANNLIRDPKQAASTVKQQFNQAAEVHKKAQKAFYDDHLNTKINMADTNMVSAEIKFLQQLLDDLNLPSSAKLKAANILELVDDKTKKEIQGKLNNKIQALKTQLAALQSQKPPTPTLKSNISGKVQYNTKYFEDAPATEKAYIDGVISLANDLISKLTGATTITQDILDVVVEVLETLTDIVKDNPTYTKAHELASDMSATINGLMLNVGASNNRTAILTAIEELKKELNIKAAGKKPSKKKIKENIESIVNALLDDSGKVLADFTAREFLETISDIIGKDMTKMHFNIIKEIFSRGMQLQLILPTDEIEDTLKSEIDNFQNKKPNTPDFSSTPEMNIWLDIFKDKFYSLSENKEVTHKDGVYTISGDTYNALANILNLDENSEVKISKQGDDIIVSVKSSGKFKVKGVRLNQFRRIGKITQASTHQGVFYDTEDSWNHSLIKGEYDLKSLGEQLKVLFVAFTSKQDNIKANALSELITILENPTTELSKLITQATGIESNLVKAKWAKLEKSLDHMSKVFFFAQGKGGNYKFPIDRNVDGSFSFSPSKFLVNIVGWTSKVDRDIINYEKLVDLVNEKTDIRVPIAYISKGHISNWRSKKLDANGRPEFKAGSITERTNLSSKEAVIAYSSKNTLINKAKNVSRPIVGSNFIHWLMVPVFGLDSTGSKHFEPTPIFYNNLGNIGTKADPIINGIMETAVKIYENTISSNNQTLKQEVNRFLSKKMNNLLYFSKQQDFDNLKGKQAAFTYNTLSKPSVKIAIMEADVSSVEYDGSWKTIDKVGVRHDISETEARHLIRNIKTSLTNSLIDIAGEFSDINPLTGQRESLALDGKMYESYSQFLIENDLIGVSIEKVVDSSGNFMTNSVPFFNDMDLRRPIVVNLNLLDMVNKTKGKSKSNPPTPPAPQNVPQTPPQPTPPTPTPPVPPKTTKDAVKDFMISSGSYNELIDPLLDLMDSFNINFSSEIAPIEATYIFNPDTNTIQPGTKFEARSIATKFSQFVHEIIHGRIENLTATDKSFLLSDVNKFVEEFIKEPIVKELLDRVAKATGATYDGSLESLRTILTDIYTKSKVDDVSKAVTEQEMILVEIFANSFINEEDIEEFITYGLTNTTIIDYLNTIEYKGPIAEFKNKSFWDIVIDIITKYFNINLKDKTYFRKLESILKENEPGSVKQVPTPQPSPAPSKPNLFGNNVKSRPGARGAKKSVVSEVSMSVQDIIRKVNNTRQQDVINRIKHCS